MRPFSVSLLVLGLFTPETLALVVQGDLKEPFGVDFDASGAIYIVEMGAHRVRKMDKDGTLHAYAGTGEKGDSGDGGPATQATLNGPHHLRVGPGGDLFITDTWNQRVRKVDARTGLITTVAGTGRKGFSGDGGPATQADFGGIYCIAFDPKGETMYVCDLDNRRIRSVHLRTGIVTTVAGNGQKGVPQDGQDATAQPLVDPRAVAADSRGNVYILERGGHALRVVDPAGKIRTVAGTGKAGHSGDGGPALEATLNGPKHLSCDADGRVLIADAENHVIRRYRPQDRTIEAVAGTGRPGTAGLGGPPAQAELHRPHGVIVHPSGAIYISDSENNRVVRIEK